MSHLFRTADVAPGDDTAATPRSSRPADPVVVTSAWPWRGSEKRAIVLTSVVGLAVAVLGQGWWWTSVAVGLGASFWLYRIGRHRKNRSLVTATITQDRIRLSSSTLMGSSGVAIDAVDQVGCRDFQSDRALLLIGGGASARVPERLLTQEPVRELVTRVLGRDPHVSADARDLLVRVGLG